MSNLSSVSGGPSLSSDSKPLPPALLVPQSSSSEQQPQAQQQQQQTTAGKRKRSLPGTPDPDAEVIALSPRTLLTTNRFVCEICNKGFQRDQNLQLHRRGHNLPWKLKQRSGKDIRKRVYICPETSCVHHDPARALGDLTGVKKHFCRKHGEKKWKCEKCSKRYAVQSDWKAHSKTCGTREYRCDCGTLFSRRDSFITHRAFCDALAEESVRASVGSMALPHMPAGIPTAPSGSVLLGHGSTVLQHHHHHHQHHHNQQQQQASASSLSLYRTTAGGGAGIFRTGPAQQFPFSVRSSNCVTPVRPHLSLWPETPEDQQQQQHIPNAAGFFTATKPGMLAGLHDYEEPCKSMVNMMPSSCSSTHNSNNTSSNNNNTNNGTGGGAGGGATVSAGHSLYSNILNSVVLNSSSDTDFGAVANWPDRPPAASASRLSLSNSSASTDNYNNNNNSSSNNSNNTNSNATNNMDSIYSNMNVNLYANMSGLPQMSATALLQKAAQMGATASNTGNAAAFGMAGSENAAAGAGGGHVSLALAGPASTSQQQHHHHHHNPFSLLSSDHQHQQHQQQGLKISENAAAELMMSSMFNNLSDTGALNKLMMNMAAAAGSSSSAAAMAEQERLTRDFLGVGAPFMPPPPGSHMDHFVMYSRDSNTGHAPAAVAAAAAAAKSSMKTTATATSPSTSWDATA